MVLAKTEYNENYFNGRNTGIKLAWGYGDIKEERQESRLRPDLAPEPYNARIKGHFDKILEGGRDLTGVQVLDVGGAIGNFAKHAKSLGIGIWDVLDLNIDDWCNLNKWPEVDNFFTGDAVVDLNDNQKFTTNSYDVIFSASFLECIDPLELPALITGMNRVAKTVQIHIINTRPPAKFAEKYHNQPLSWWATQGFNRNTLLIDWLDNTSLLVT